MAHIAPIPVRVRRIQSGAEDISMCHSLIHSSSKSIQMNTLIVESWSRNGNRGEARLNVDGKIVTFNGDATIVAMFVELAKTNCKKEIYM